MTSKYGFHIPFGCFLCYFGGGVAYAHDFPYHHNIPIGLAIYATGMWICMRSFNRTEVNND